MFVLSALVGAAFALLTACSASSSEDDAGKGGPDVPASEATSLTFVPATTVALAPRETRSVNVVAGPPEGNYTVRFALVPENPDEEPNDASLDRSEGITDEYGIASVVITAPSKPTTLTLRASIGDKVDALLAISVSDEGFGTIIVDPKYAGSRTVDSWVASIRVGSTCADLTGFPPPDGALSAETSANNKPSISSVPVGVVTAVSVRAGKFAYGCTNLKDLTTDETRTLTVDVADRPMALEEGTLGLSLTFDTSTKEWTTHLESAIDAALVAFHGYTATDADLLLGEMSAQIASSTSRSDFDARRLSSGFDAVAASHVGTDALRAAASQWLTQGASKLSDSSLEGEVAFDGQSAQFTLISAGGVPTASSGFLGSSTWNAFADPGDTLVLGGSLMFQTARWVAAMAEAPAIAEHVSASNAAEALAEIAECDELGAELANAGGAEIYAGCSSSCAAKLCKQALVSLWASAENGGSELSTLSVAVTGAAAVDDEARPISLDGTWVGTLGDGKISVVGGAAVGAIPSQE